MKKLLIIVGSAPCVLEDLAKLPPIEADYMIIGLDAVDKYLGTAAYCATFHPAEIPKIIERRRLAGGNTDWKMVSHEPRPGVDIVTSHNGSSGSSAMLGILTALNLGYDGIICCGCPLEGPKRYEAFRNGWTVRMALIKDKVRSMSGWTMKLVGAPTEEWLNG